jgi:small subunit ribosomal protein S1
MSAGAPGLLFVCSSSEVNIMTTAASNPWETPLDESYWHGLLSDAERATSSSEQQRSTWGRTTETPSYTSAAYQEPGPDLASDGGNSAGPTNYSRAAGSLDVDWQRATQLLESKERADLKVVGCNRGGLLVQFGQIQGFVPASQLLDLPHELNSQARQVELTCRVGDTLCLRVIELDRDRNRLIFSERAAAHDQDARLLLESLVEGDVCTGRVTSLCGFGAFVDLGGVEGLIHISELSWGRVNHPSDVVKPGDQVEVYVMGVEPEQHRVALSLKYLKPDPWTLVDERYEVGQLVEAEITNVVSFGAFARVDDGLEGLIHISELAEGNFLHPRNVVQEGEQIVARILNIDSTNHRLGLSLRHVHNHLDDTQAIMSHGYSA